MVAIASDAALIFLIVWFVALAAASLAYMLDYRGWLSRVVDQRVLAGQQAAFDATRSSRQPDRAEVLQQQRIAASVGVGVSALVLILCVVALSS